MTTGPGGPEEKSEDVGLATGRFLTVAEVARYLRV